VDFDPPRGQEINKTRPAVVVSGDTIGKLALKVVVPITDWKPHYIKVHWFVQLVPSDANGLLKASGADAFQINSVSTDRFKRRIGALSSEDLKKVIAAIAACIEYKGSET
jgi:mRNA interferase MazF